MLGDIKSVRWLYVKGVLMLLVGVMGGVILWMEVPTWRTAGLLAVTVWGFCRAYYFAFYVVEHYADPEFKFAGLGAFLRYAWVRGKRKLKDKG